MEKEWMRNEVSPTVESTSRNEAARPRNEQLVFPPVAKGHGHSDFPFPSASGAILLGVHAVMHSRGL